HGAKSGDDGGEVVGRVLERGSVEGDGAMPRLGDLPPNPLQVSTAIRGRGTGRPGGTLSPSAFLAGPRFRCDRGSDSPASQGAAARMRRPDDRLPPGSSRRDTTISCPDP